MKNIREFYSLTEYNDAWGMKTKHPMVHVDDCGILVNPEIKTPYTANLYAVFLVGEECIDHFIYGDRQYALQKNSLIFLSPGQVIQYPDDGNGGKISGRGLYFAPDLIYHYSLAQQILYHKFFSYELAEGLLLTTEESELINKCFDSISHEIEHWDTCSNNIIVANITLLLEHCTRFHLQQEADKSSSATNTLVALFEKLVIDSIIASASGFKQIPSVTWFAKECGYSTKHFINLIKKHTGQTPYKYVQKQLIKYACVLLSNSDIQIKFLAEMFGFKHHQSFARIFKRETGYSPNEFRQKR